VALPELKHLTEASIAATRILEQINRVPQINADDSKGLMLDRLQGGIKFESVHFAYPSRPDMPVLQDFNLQIPAGQTVALVGSSGSGKSTAIALVQQFYDASEGTVKIDEVDIKELQLKWIRSKMGLVSQDHAMFGTSIRENILLGKPDASIDEIYSAAMAANAHNFIRELPEEYETKVCASRKHSANHNSLPVILYGCLFTILADWRARSIAVRWPKAAYCHCKGIHQEPCYTSA
jgi:ATP-binding cassette subfamily B (MDR/TAP) protein 1